MSKQSYASCALIALGAVAVMADVLSADAPQVRLPSGAQIALTPDFAPRDIAALKHDLNLDADQAKLINTLLTDYDSLFASAVEPIKLRLENTAPAFGQERPAITQRRKELRERMSQLIDQLVQERTSQGSKQSQQQTPSPTLLEMQRIQTELKTLGAEQNDPAKLQNTVADVAAGLKPWLVEKTRLRAEFAADVLTLLRADQDSLWPALDRRLYREKSIEHGFLSGESVDVLQLVEGLQLSDESALAVANDLNAYEVRLDEVLRVRDKYLSESLADYLGAIVSRDKATIESLLRKQIEVRKAIQTVNDEAVARLRPEVSEAQAAKLSHEYNVRASPTVYQPTRLQLAFQSVGKMTGVTPESVSAIQKLDESYLSELATMNQELMEIVSKYEADELVKQVQRDVAGADVGGAASAQPSAISEGFARRTQLDDRFAKQLQALLTPEQYAQLSLENASGKKIWARPK